MKKLSIAVAVAGAFAATTAGAAVMGEYDQGCLVPSAIHGSGADTVVGITNRTANSIHWTFFDVNSNHVSDGRINATANDLTAFSLATSAGALTTGIQGYLTFSAVSAGTDLLATTTEAISCNAFYVTSSDAAFIPSPAMTSSDYLAAAKGNVTTLGPASIIALNMGSGYVHSVAPASASAMQAQGIHMRYWIDGSAGGRDTSVVIWTSASATAVGPFTVNMFNDAQTPQSVTMSLTNTELNVYNPENQVGRPATFLDGFVDWSLTNALASGVLVYSVVSDPAFGATQTLMGASYGTGANAGN